MTTVEPRPPVQPGEPAPDFTLPAVEREGTVSLADYRGKSSVLLAINRGLWCSFCRRHMVQLGGTREQLQRLGVETLAIVASDSERARLYVRHRPLRVPLAADTDLVTHRAYGLSMPPMPPEFERVRDAMRLRLDQTAFNAAELSQLAEAIPSAHGDRAAEVPLNDLRAAQARLYPHELSESETRERARYATQSTGQFLVDQQGLVRWTKVQGFTDPPATFGNVPTERELLAAARALPK